VLSASIIRAINTSDASTSETSVNFYKITRRYNPEHSHLHACRRENLKSYYSVHVCYIQWAYCRRIIDTEEKLTSHGDEKLDEGYKGKKLEGHAKRRMHISQS
jgi:hypothetical protein